MRTAERHVSIQVRLKVFDIGKSTSDNNASHRMPNKAESGSRSKIDRFEKVIKLDG